MCYATDIGVVYIYNKYVYSYTNSIEEIHSLTEKYYLYWTMTNYTAATPWYKYSKSPVGFSVLIFDWTFLAERPVYPNTTLPCTPNPCDPSSTCQVYGGEVAMCDPCSGPSGHYNPSCHPECLYNSDCPFNLACLNQKCVDSCPGSCGVGAQCVVVHHEPVCSCPQSLTGNPYEHCSPIS